MIGSYWMASIALSALAFALAAGLLVVYVRNWHAAPSRFSRGLVAFAALVVVANALSAWAFYGLAQGYGKDVALPLIGIKLAESAAYATLLFVTWE